jgi:transposase
VTNPKSPDLRQAVIRALSRGQMQQEVARCFGISQATVSRWLALSRTDGALEPRRTGGDRRSVHAEQHLGQVLALTRTLSVFSIRRVKAALAEQDIIISYGALRRLMMRHRTAIEAARPTRPTKNKEC